MLERRSWKEFMDTKLLWWVNRTLHLFGWTIILVYEQDGTVSDAYPARTSNRGFDEATEAEGFVTLSQYLANNMKKINIEISEPSIG